MRSVLMIVVSILLVSNFAAAQDGTVRSIEKQTANANEVIRNEPAAEQASAPEKSETVLQDTKEISEVPAPTPTPTPVPSTVQNPTYTRPDFKTRFSRYRKNMFGPSAFIGPVFGAGIRTITNSPPEWRRSGKGYAKRYASGFGKNLIKETTVFALDEAFQLDSYYYRSTKKDLGSRLKHALVSSFTAKNKNGKTVVGFPRIVGIYTAEIVAVEAWYPKRYTYQDALRQGTYGVSTNILNNLVKEFIFR